MVIVVEVKTLCLPQSLGAAVSAGVFLLFTANSPAQNLFVSCLGDNSIVEISPTGGESLFASGLNSPYGLAFDSAGDLFEADEGSGNVYEFINNDGTLSTTPTLFASGLDQPVGLAINTSTGNLFVSEYGNGDIEEITSGGTTSIVATGLDGPEGMILLGVAPLPELAVANQKNGTITEIPLSSVIRGTKTFSVSGAPAGLTEIGGTLYFTEQGGTIDKITGTLRTTSVSTVVSGLNDPNGLVASGNNLFEADTGSGEINEMIGHIGTGIPPTLTFTETNFVSGLDEPMDLVFQAAPEPSEWGLMAAGLIGLFVRRWRRFLTTDKHR